MTNQEITELINGAITNLESPHPTQWSPEWIEKLKLIGKINAQNGRLKRVLQNIVDVSYESGSDGKLHREAIHWARCAVAIESE